ncbi:molybdopterin dinucleotide binding domain-containing protein [Lignipirellula cremea]|uniref:Molybdopterin dinucleotide binding domain protein n=1 Tax=Lignipirellula cremea TaxID=2528010 RepID=A0A518DTQ5_9BACT|nr:molybdopterin dinucleotide binding domain-containing protein [Lignipirellula cremea]QDU95198.1 molybdopterin dinucleotide binding domain protein [Lignipirellula cremea]
MEPRKFLLNPSRTAKQGAQINISKDDDVYIQMTTTLTISPADMEYLGVAQGDSVRVRTEHGEAEFTCESGKVPDGIIFVVYGPPTCKLMGGGTDGTGMPTSKGWEIEIEPIRNNQ